MLKSHHLPVLRNARGYTIDQTILIVAIIAILVTIIIISVGWSLLNKASGSKLASQLRQVEDASGQFYAEHRMWPHQAITAPDAAANIRALSGIPTPITAWQPGVVVANVKNLIPGFRSNGAATNHTFSNGGAVTMMNASPSSQNTSVPGDNEYLVVQFADVPVAEIQSADQAIDGTAGSQTGRLVFSASTCLPGTADTDMPTLGAAPATGNAFVCYIANLVQ
jgi:hypothetical protein